MALSAVLISAGDSAHEPVESAETSEDIAVCDDHAEEMSSSAAMTAAWAFTPRSMAWSVRESGVTEGPFIDGADPTGAHSWGPSPVRVRRSRLRYRTGLPSDSA